jgi:hypothetical protein
MRQNILKSKRSNSHLHFESQKNFLKCKRSQEAGTLSWIFGTFMVLIIMIIYIVLTGALFAKSGGTNTGQFDTLSTSAITESLIGFLNSDAGEYGTVYDLVKKSDADDSFKANRLEIYKSKSKTFLWTNFPGGTENNPDYTAWIRVYPINENIGQYTDLTGLTARYEVSQVYWGHQTTDLCVPGISNLIVIPILLDKKIAVCWQKHPYAK